MRKDWESKSKSKFPGWTLDAAVLSMDMDIYARALQGNASNRNALEVGKRAGLIAERGWQIARTHK